MGSSSELPEKSVPHNIQHNVIEFSLRPEVPGHYSASLQTTLQRHEHIHLDISLSYTPFAYSFLQHSNIFGGLGKDSVVETWPSFHVS